jgi:hypothetical protein
MYKITLKIRDRKPIMLDDDKGLQVKSLWTDSKVQKDYTIALDDIIFEKGKIDTIEYIKASQKPITPENMYSTSDLSQYLDWKNKSPEEKAKRLDLYIHLFRQIHKKEPSKEILDMLHQELVQFFKANPKRTYANWPIYQKYLIDKRKGHVINTVQYAGVVISARACANDSNNALYSK